jgi:fructose/tagatose bisphosphate aldolase
MPLVPFTDLLADARRGHYAVGYFESWSLESLLAVADAAEAQRAPVVLGFSGVYLPHPRRKARDPLAAYAAMALSVCRSVSVPAALMFNESPDRAWCSDAVRLGFNAVMYSNEADDPATRLRAVADLVAEAHAAGAAVEAEMESPAGVAGDLRETLGGMFQRPSSARLGLSLTKRSSTHSLSTSARFTFTGGPWSGLTSTGSSVWRNWRRRSCCMGRRRCGRTILPAPLNSGSPRSMSAAG